MLINFRGILVANGHRGWILRDKKVCEFWSDLQLQRLGRKNNLKQDSMCSNPQPPAHEVDVKTIVPSYSVNNITMSPELADTRAIQVWR